MHPAAHIVRSVRNRPTFKWAAGQAKGDFEVRVRTSYVVPKGPFINESPRTIRDVTEEFPHLDYL